MYDDDVQVAGDLLERGAVDVTCLVTHRIRLDEVIAYSFKRLTRAESETLTLLVGCTTSGNANEPIPEQGAP